MFGRILTRLSAAFRKGAVFFAAVILGTGLSSCFGLKADISVKADGSGRIALEYRVAGELDSLGRLDGNRRWETIPTGRADFERTMSRLPRLKLRSFSRKEEGGDLINRALIDFAGLEDLLPLLDAGGEDAVLDKRGNKTRLLLRLTRGAKLSAETLALLESVFPGRGLELNFKVPAEGELSLLDREGTPAGEIEGAVLVNRGKELSFSIPLSRLLSLEKGLSVEALW
ncbi:MAG: hypothetical protein LBT87_08915 [Treponema sp.]|jgi:hypothetical protein|nr:hypothetical protein [Treponema sp.]